MNSIRDVLRKYAEVEVESPRSRPEDPEFPFEGQLEYQGIQIDIENKKGSIRTGTDPDGNEWSIEMKSHYGEIRNTEAVDGDKLDVYVGPEEDVKWVYVVHQVHPGTHEKAGEFDEDKVMLGYSSANEAIRAYQDQYDRDDFFGGMSMIPLSKFKAWIERDETDGLPAQPPVQWKHPNLGPDEPPRTGSVSNSDSWDRNTFLALIEEGQDLAERFDRESKGMRSFTSEDLNLRCR